MDVAELGKIGASKTGEKAQGVNANANGLGVVDHLDIGSLTVPKARPMK